jgi:hypothetical protein
VFFQKYGKFSPKTGDFGATSVKKINQTAKLISIIQCKLLDQTDVTHYFCEKNVIYISKNGRFQKS